MLIQAAYEVAMDNLIGYATTITTLFWEDPNGFENEVSLSLQVTGGEHLGVGFRV